MILLYFDTYGFDQDLFWDENGSVYLCNVHGPLAHEPRPAAEPNFGIYISKIDLATGKSLIRPRLICNSPTGIAEGPHIFKRCGFYYLLAAEGGTDSKHHECIYRSKDIYGPYEKCPKLLLDSSNTFDIHNAGHVDFIMDDDDNT